MSALPHTFLPSTGNPKQPNSDVPNHQLMTEVIKSLIKKWKWDMETWVKEFNYFSKMVAGISGAGNKDLHLSAAGRLIDTDVHRLNVEIQQFENKWLQEKPVENSEVEQKRNMQDFNNLQMLVSQINVEFSSLKLSILDLLLKKSPLRFI